VHGSDGRWSRWSHQQGVFFAAHGFLAFPFGYSKGGNFWNAGKIIDVPLDKTAEALLSHLKNGECGLPDHRYPEYAPIEPPADDIRGAMGGQQQGVIRAPGRAIKPDSCPQRETCGAATASGMPSTPSLAMSEESHSARDPDFGSF
jgi:hypothetical protein